MIRRNVCRRALVIGGAALIARVARAAPKLAASRSRDLFDGKTLGDWKATSFGGEGAVRVEKGHIVIGRGEPLSGISWAGAPLPKIDYQLEVEAQRVSGNDFFCTLTVPVGPAFVSLVVGGWGGTLVGLSSVDDLDASENETKTNRTFRDGRWYRLRLVVAAGRISAFVDTERVVDLATAGRRLSIRPEVDPCRPLGIATFATAAAIRTIRLKSL